MINKPTRITQYSATLIDNILINYLSNFTNKLLWYILSYHLPILLAIDLKPKKAGIKNKGVYRIINKLNTTKFIEKLKTLDWYMLKQACIANRPDLAYTTFLEIFIKYYNEAFTMATNSTNNAKFKKPCTV